MGLTSALTTSLNGLALNETTIDVLGNNIANAGTVGFKASRVYFSTQLARTLSFGSRPSDSDGGTNPRQIGLGADVAAISPDFTQGSLTATTSASDLAIQGDGFFILETSDGQVYTRNGSFRRDAGDKLSSIQGSRLLGYGVDSDFNLITTSLTSITIPLGSLQLAQQTTEVQIGGALSPQGEVATRGTLLTSEAFVDSSTSAAANAATLLTNARRAAVPAAALFNLGDTVSIAPVKGGRTVEAKSLTVTATTSMQDLLDLFTNTLGLQSAGGIPVDADGIAVGASINATGQVLVKGNRGAVNDLEITVGTITANGTTVPISFTASADRANGEGATTSFTVYDSLGTALTLKIAAYLEEQVSGRTTYRYLLESADQSGPTVIIGNGTVDFDSVGRVSSAPTSQFSLDRSTSSAVNPMLFTLDVSRLSGISSTGSQLNLLEQNGTNPGTLTSFIIDERGVINGAFDNGIIRTLGQVVLARFSNPAGLLQSGTDSWKQGIASGLPQLSTPGSFGVGTVRAGALEQSNTDLGKNLVDLIVAATNYRGNARVISSVDQLVNELLVLGRG
jgi:flagellar hook protein FlgE